jgi:DMSO/TMAO reductase YedYZ molybdopterin-dependent catalytic subunit
MTTDLPLSGRDRPVPKPYTRPIRFGRGAFLGLSAVTAGALFFSRKSVPSFNFSPGAQSAYGFTIYTVVDGYPAFHGNKYRLSVDGMTEKQLSLSMSDVLALPAVHEERYYQCVTGWTVPHATWTGVRLSHLLDMVSPHPDAGAVKFYSFDGVYTESLTMDQARASDVLLAYTLMGKPLSQQQGAPLRLVVPGMYGYKFIKWVDRVELIPKPIDGYWEQNGYDRDAYIGRSNGV